MAREDSFEQQYGNDSGKDGRNDACAHYETEECPRLHQFSRRPYLGENQCREAGFNHSGEGERERDIESRWRQFRQPLSSTAH